MFTVGIKDDVTNLSVDFDPDFSTEGDDVVRALFYGLGSDGTVGANRNSVKIIGENTPLYAQGYFVYDSRKAGSVTTSHSDSARVRSRVRTWFTRPTSWPATSSTSSNGSTFFRWPCRGRRSC